jgi:hypothetical protein
MLVLSISISVKPGPIINEYARIFYMIFFTGYST